MSKYNVYLNSECVWEGDDYDVALQEYTDCINENPDAVIDLYEIDRYGNEIKNKVHRAILFPHLIDLTSVILKSVRDA